MKKKTLVYNCIIDEVDQETGIYAISFVDMPANEVDFVALKTQSPQNTLLSRDHKKQVLTGAILKPDQLIYRYSPQQGEYYIKFSAQEIEKISQKMMKTGIALTNTTHQHQKPLTGNYLTELWIVEDPQKDKSQALGFNNLPKGTLMCSYKIEDTQYWQQEVMTGNVKGFSLEGFFNQKINMSRINTKQKTKYPQMNKQKKTLLEKLASLLLSTEDVVQKDSTHSGEAYVLFVLADGNQVYVDQDGFATMNDQQMPAGEHNLADGNLLAIDQNGQFVETIKASKKANKPAESVAPQTMRKRVRLQEFEPKTAQAVKAKIAEMQTIIDELAQALTDAQSMIEDTKTEVEEMRKKTPSTQPLKHKLSFPNTETIDSWHRARGFASIGYHYVIYLDGTVHQGRPLAMQGAHTIGHNAHSIGICYIGGVEKDGRTPKDTRTPKQKEALKTLVGRLKETYPQATIHGHNEFANKACPSFDVKKEF